jgi:two-component system sensor kinase FixL
MEAAEIVLEISPREDEGSALNVNVNVDTDQLRQALLNVFRNALEALLESEKPRTLQVNFHQESETVAVHIHDSGSGIDPQVADGIFEPFVTGKSGGTGLGLSLSQQIIEAHGGTIRVSERAEPLGGASFQIELPKLG